jgi:hypothetical protein
MKSNSAKYLLPVALMLALAAGTAEAQQRQNAQVQSRQHATDQSAAGTMQQRQQQRLA